MFRVFVQASSAQRFLMPTLQTHKGVGQKARCLPMYALPLRNSCYSWYDIPGYQEASETLVPCNLASDQSKIWGERAGIATYS